MYELNELLKNSRKAARSLALLTEEEKNKALYAIADGLEENASEILLANQKDVEKGKEKLGEVMIDRLTLTLERIKGMADGVRAVAALPDPVGRVLACASRPNGLKIEKRSVPLGVVAIVYESRPNVTSDGAALCLKSGNACVLRGGSDAYYSSMKIVEIIKTALKKVGVDENAVSMPSDKSRENVTALMTAVGQVDALIPRGGASLIRSCVENAKVPCIQTGTGICHIYVDKDADISMALDVLENAKTSRPSVCNAAEVCLVDRAIAESFLPLMQDRLCAKRKKVGKNPVKLRLCENSFSIIDGERATKEDFDTEFLDYILAVKIVNGVDEAIEHISLHSTGHSESIVTTNQKTAEKFLNSVDSAAVYWNASTRFTDGGEFGKGCEIGISTQKLHARGPMGLEELTSYKYVIYGNGQIR
jgi:glutamate-5-semialdehyde dehydrogenase